MDIKLKHYVTGGKSHLIELPDIPRRNNVATGLWVASELIYDIFDLISFFYFSVIVY